MTIVLSKTHLRSRQGSASAGRQKRHDGAANEQFHSTRNSQKSSQAGSRSRLSVSPEPIGLAASGQAPSTSLVSLARAPQHIFLPSPATPASPIRSPKPALNHAVSPTLATAHPPEHIIPPFAHLLAASSPLLALPCPLHTQQPPISR